MRLLVELRRELDVGGDIEIFRAMMRKQWERADRALDEFDAAVFGSGALNQTPVPTGDSDTPKQ